MSGYTTGTRMGRPVFRSALGSASRVRPGSRRLAEHGVDHLDGPPGGPAGERGATERHDIEGGRRLRREIVLMHPLPAALPQVPADAPPEPPHRHQGRHGLTLTRAD